MSYKFGKVSYINSLPLFCAGAPKGFDIVADYPARLNGAVVRGELDVSLISRWVYADVEKTYKVIPQYCIAGDGEIMSVKLFSKVPLFDLNRAKIFITSETGTSSRAFRFLILKKFGVDIFRLPRAEMRDADAVLLIGNAALAFDPARFDYSYDLGEAWKELTGFKMIYAVFVARRDVYDAVAPEVSAFLEKSLNLFKAQKKVFCEIAREQFEKSEGSEISRDIVEKYYSRLIYKLGADEFDRAFNFVRDNGNI